MHPSQTCPLPFNLVQQPASSISTRARQVPLGLAEVVFGLKACNKLYRQLEHDGTMADFAGRFSSTGCLAAPDIILTTSSPFGHTAGLEKVHL